MQVILADSGYPCRGQLLPVFRTAQVSGEHARRRDRFNKITASTRIVIEQSFGTLKSRFPYILDRVRVRPVNAARIFLCCCGLHNLLINLGYGFLEDVLATEYESGEP